MPLTTPRQSYPKEATDPRALPYPRWCQSLSLFLTQVLTEADLQGDFPFSIPQGRQNFPIPPGGILGHILYSPNYIYTMLCQIGTNFAKIDNLIHKTFRQT